INGIGPKMEEVLNSIGIFTFAQVSKMTKKEYDLLDEITGSFQGRAERDDWSGQAKKLIN
ncbi:MAG: molybdopterin oxidoreductase, partial [Olleya sp.]